MTTSKDGTAYTEIGQHNVISVVMEDLLEAKRVALQKELQEEMAACHTPFRDSGNEASIRVPRMFHSHV
jgi:hypothetical protein